MVLSAFRRSIGIDFTFVFIRDEKSKQGAEGIFAVCKVETGDISYGVNGTV